MLQCTLWHEIEPHQCCRHPKQGYQWWHKSKTKPNQNFKILKNKITTSINYLAHLIFKCIKSHLCQLLAGIIVLSASNGHLHRSVALLCFVPPHYCLDWRWYDLRHINGIVSVHSLVIYAYWLSVVVFLISSESSRIHCSCETMFHCRWQRKLREGNIFTDVCLFTGKEVGI